MSDPITSERLAAIREREAEFRSDTSRLAVDTHRVTGDDRHALLAEVERLHSWDGLMSLLNEHWPDWLFLTAPDPEDYQEPLYWMRPDDQGMTRCVRANPGVMITGLLRWVDRLTAERDALRAQVTLAPDEGYDSGDRHRNPYRAALASAADEKGNDHAE